MKYINISKLLLCVLVFAGLQVSCNMSDKNQPVTGAITVRTDDGSIIKGKSLFRSKCVFCHQPNSTEIVVGPGLQGILKQTALPVSKKSATPENIINQLRRPYKDMPSFTYLSEEEVLNIIAYLNTL
jgi:mono/diheme cytochrome c family protein